MMRTRSLVSSTLLARVVPGALLLAAGAAFGAGQDEEFVVVKAGSVITISGEEIPDGEIVIVDGKIRLVGTRLEYPAGATVIDARGETVMPGWINPYSRHGLTGYSRSGVHGDYTLEHEIYPAELDFEPMLAAGYTAVALYPDGQGIPGVATVYRTGFPEGRDPLDDDPARLRDTSYLRVLMRDTGSSKQQFAGALAKAKGELEKIKKAREEWDKKQKEAAAKKAAEAEKAKKEGGQKPAEQPSAPGQDNGDAKKPEEKPEEFKPPATDPGVQPLMDWLEGKLTVRPLIELGNAATLLHLEEVLEKYDDLAPNLMVSGGDLNYVIEQLAARDAIILTPLDLTTMPQTSTRFNAPGALAKAGADLALMPEAAARGGGGGFRGRRGGRPPVATAPTTANAEGAMRTARQRVANLVRNGLDRGAALRGVTLMPARLLGIDARVGSIEEGKDADLVFIDGDPLDPTATVTRVMILGDTVWEVEK